MKAPLIPAHPPTARGQVCLSRAVYRRWSVQDVLFSLCQASLWPSYTRVHSVPPLGGGGGWRRADQSEFALQTEQNVHAKRRSSLHVPLVRRQGAGRRLSVMTVLQPPAPKHEHHKASKQRHCHVRHNCAGMLHPLPIPWAVVVIFISSSMMTVFYYLLIKQFFGLAVWLQQMQKGWAKVN